MKNLLEVRGLKTSFSLAGGNVPIVEGVDFDVRRGEVLGIIGESGSGKTVSCMSILRLLPEHAVVTAERLWFDGTDLGAIGANEFQALRGRQLAMIFQDPAGSFNPAKTIGWHFRQVSLRALRDKSTGNGSQTWKDKAVAVLKRVGIPHAEEILRRYPHQLSGGMLQRALIALVLQLRPALIVADEPTTNLDNIVEHQIIGLFRDLKEEVGSSFIFITHDMSVAQSLCDRIAVMYAGQIVEMGTTDQILHDPKHPYSAGLVRTATELTQRVDRLQEIPGELPSWKAQPTGCRFRSRCEFARDGCELPQQMRDLGEDREVRCLLYGEVV